MRRYDKHQFDKPKREKGKLTCRACGYHGAGHYNHEAKRIECPDCDRSLKKLHPWYDSTRKVRV